jgi:hypothetical protein
MRFQPGVVFWAVAAVGRVLQARDEPAIGRHNV